jgi:thiol-disulfide isomerase/thioredoxin
MKHVSISLGLVLACVTASSTFAGKIGDAAAPLKIKEWVKGKAVDVKDGKNLYVVEFWATWCGPCRVSIPHLTELQKQFKDKGVVVVGVSDETLDKVKPFVESEAGKMDYVVAIDDERATSKGYMEAYGQNGIPHAFVVGKDGKVIWHGHPMAGLDKAIEEMVAGKYDVKAAIKADEGRAAVDEYHQLARNGDAKAKELGQKLIEEKKEDKEGLCDFAFAIVADLRNNNRDFALADAALDRAEKLAGGKDARVTSVRAIGRFENGNPDEGMRLMKQAVDYAKDAKEKSRYEGFVKVMEQRKDSVTKKPATTDK